jgi:hypothetical protein
VRDPRGCGKNLPSIGSFVDAVANPIAHRDRMAGALRLSLR